MVGREVAATASRPSRSTPRRTGSVAAQRFRTLPKAPSPWQARELRLRAQAWPRTLIGLIGMDPCNRVIMDRVIFEGTLDWTPVDLPEILRETLRAGCAQIVVYRWAPRPEVAVSSEDRRIADELRVMGSILGITLIDYIVITEQSYWSGRCEDGWAV